MEPLAVNVEEAGRLVGLSKHTIRAYIRKGILPAIHAGRRVLVPIVSLHRLARDGAPTLGPEKSCTDSARGANFTERSPDPVSDASADGEIAPSSQRSQALPGRGRRRRRKP